jgi:type IV pilus assembly protein PilY1
MDATFCFKPFHAGRLYRVFMAGALALGCTFGWAQSTDIATAPLFTTQANTVKPNLLFVLDDSGSMGWNYMPDEVNDNLSSSAYGQLSYQCNGVQYDPSYTYTPPVKADGTSYSNASFSSAWNDGFDTTAGTTNLANSYYYKYTGTQPKMGWTFTATGPITSTTFYSECNSSVGSAPGSSVFTKVTLTSSSSDAQNYANWYAYYRTRMQMMKTAVGIAFKDLDSKYRIGFTTIHRKLPLLNVADFDSTQKASFYSQLYGSSTGNSTPLRGALSRAGQYYANMAPGQVSDPVQYSCQRNYTLLSTDGYWNTGNETTGSGANSNFSAYKLDNLTAVGEQDGVGTSPPYFDGQQVISGKTSGGSSNSLADIAMYYYTTDLRDASLSNCTGALGQSVCKNNVGTSKDDAADWQHMTTFSLGLGAGSSLTYTFDYQTRKSGDYYDILQGTKNWPVAKADTPTAIDDLWHAAVNGRGRFFSVQNAKDLAAGLDATLDQIRATTGSASAAATSTLQPVQGDNDVFVAQFTTVTWVGEIKKFSIDPSSGLITPVANWSVQAALENKSPSARNIYYKAASTNTLMAFNVSNLTSDGYLGYFSNFCSKTGAMGSGNPTQCASLTSSDLTSANTASNLVSFLRGDKSASYYRVRDKLLGDIVNASPVFVGKPGNLYTENNYAAFKTNNSTRLGVVYAAANDGMLHAFRQDTGEELWAYIPTAMLSKLYKLADNNYSDYHDYYVDGTPSVGDAYIGGQWRTILVGGYRAGGKGYYALDITDPQNPAMLWEFSDVDLGYSFGNPIITKRANGTWVVVFASGYNNHTGGGDGNGHLYIVNAATGALIKKLDTFTDAAGTVPAGTTTVPSGLAMINAWVDFDTENLAKRFYGADLLGNVWRFDIDSNVQPYNSAFLLATMRDGTGANLPQSITTLPILAQVTYSGTTYPVVYVATGKYLGLSDLSTTQQESSYVFIDPLTATSYGDIRAANVLVNKNTATTAVDWLAKRGWYYDYPTAGERANVNSSISLSTITTATNVPSSDLCALGGSSYIYNFDLTTGNYKQHYMGATLTVGATVVQLTADGASGGATVTISTNSKGEVTTTDNTSASSSAVLHRTSWRELD